MNHQLTSTYTTHFTHTGLPHHRTDTYFRITATVSTPLLLHLPVTRLHIWILSPCITAGVHTTITPPPLYCIVTNGDLIKVYIVTDNINVGTRFTFHKKPYGRVEVNSTCPSEILNKIICDKIIASCRKTMSMSGWTNVLLIDVSSPNLSRGMF